MTDPYTQGSGIRLGELHPGNPISILCLFFTGITRLVLKKRLKGGRLGLESRILYEGGRTEIWASKSQGQVPHDEVDLFEKKLFFAVMMT